MNDINDLNIPKETLYHIWLLGPEEVLIKNIKDLQDTVTIRNLTIASDNTNDLMKQIESQWGIICAKQDLEILYEYSDCSDRHVTGFTLELYNEEQMTFVRNKFDGRFIPYKDLG